MPSLHPSIYPSIRHPALDSASDASRPDLSPTTTSPPLAPATARSSLLILGRRRARGAGAPTASPLSCSRTLPHESQETHSPSLLTRRSTPQWLHQQHALRAIDRRDAGTGSVNLWGRLLERIHAHRGYKFRRCWRVNPLCSTVRYCSSTPRNACYIYRVDEPTSRPVKNRVRMGNRHVLAVGFLAAKFFPWLLDLVAVLLLDRFA